MRQIWAPKFIMAWDIYAERILAILELPMEMQARTSPYMKQEDEATESEDVERKSTAQGPSDDVNWFDFLGLTL